MINELYFNKSYRIFDHLKSEPDPAKLYLSKINSLFISSYLLRHDNLDDVIHMLQPKICDVMKVVLLRRTMGDLGYVHYGLNEFINCLMIDCDMGVYDYSNINQKLTTINMDKKKIKSASPHTQYDQYSVEFMVIRELNKIDVYVSKKPDFGRDILKAFFKLRTNTRLGIMHKLEEWMPLVRECSTYTK